MFIIDCIEGNIVVCETEDRVQILFSVSEIYDNPKAGDCFNIIDGKYILDMETTSIRRKQIIELQNQVFE